METLIAHLIDAPLANLCVLAGLFFLGIAVVGNISGRIAPGKGGRVAAAVLGSLLFGYGVITHAQGDLPKVDVPATSTPHVGTVSGPVTKKRAFTPPQVDTDLRGADYEGFDTSSPEVCEAECNKDTRCKAWTYVKPGIQGPQAKCYLKSLIPALTLNTCCISGSLRMD
jgi:hypothetical protein